MGCDSLWLSLGFVYGLVQFVLCVPALYGYAAVIFTNPAFNDYMSALSKLVIFSSMVHQISMSLFSSLPFAVGQVQDAGLVFLAQMASSIAVLCDGEPAQVITSTAVVVLGLSTALLGVALVIIGRLKLGRYVSFLPMPVIGGYLAFIGYFCLEAGVTLCTGKVIMSPHDWLELMTAKSMILLAPAIVSGAVFSLVSRKVNHIAALPMTMLAFPLGFYVCLGISNSSLDDARDYGFVGQANQAATYVEAFQLYDFSKVRWDVIPTQIPSWIGMVFVVTFGSSLDVAAIEMDMGRPLRINHELTTVGWGNVASGLLGGFTGSYIFSSTVFNYRTKVHSKMVGWTLVLTEIGVVMWSGDPLAYIPLFFFASTLVFVAFELMLEWLIEVRAKLPFSEYLVLLVTFFAINFTGLMQGMLIGVGVAILRFVISYANQHVVEFKHMKSRVIRPPTERTLLDQHAGSIVTVQLTGEIFFGSSVQLLDEIKALMMVDEVPMPRFGRIRTPIQIKSPLQRKLKARKEIIMNKKDSKVDIRPHSKSEATVLLGAFEPEGSVNYSQIRNSAFSDATDISESSDIGSNSNTHSFIEKIRSLSFLDTPHLEAPKFLVMDCSKLTAIDASAARNCFMPLKNLAESFHFTVAYANCNAKIEFLLKAHDAIGENIKIFTTVYEALDYCEVKLLEEPHFDHIMGTSRSRIRAWSQLDYGENSSQISAILYQLLDLEDHQEDIAVLSSFCEEQRFAANEIIFSEEELADRFFIILQGEVALNQEPSNLKHRSLRSRENLSALAKGGEMLSPARLLEAKLRPPSIFGYVDYQLNQTRKFQALALTDTSLAIFHADSMDQLLESHPKALCRLQKALLKASALELNNLPSL